MKQLIIKENTQVTSFGKNKPKYFLDDGVASKKATLDFVLR